MLKSAAVCARQDKNGRWRVCGHCPACEPIVSVERQYPVEWNAQRDQVANEIPLEASDRAVYERYASEAWD